MKFLRYIPLFLCLLVGNKLAQAQFFVSPSGSGTACSSGTPCSPSQAFSAATAGQTYTFLSGTYGCLSANRPGTSGHPITYISQVQYGAKISCAPGSTDGVGFMNTGSWVVIDGFEVTTPDQSVNSKLCVGIGSNASFVIIRRNYVHDLPTAQAQCGQGGAGIDNYWNGNAWPASSSGNHDNTIDGNIVNNIGIVGFNNGVCGGFHGIYASNPNERVTNNILSNACGWGVHIFHNSTSTAVENNVIINNRNGGVTQGADSGTTNNNSITANNIVAFNGGPEGGIEDYYNGAENGSEVGWTARNNLFFGNGGPGNFRTRPCTTLNPTLGTGCSYMTVTGSIALTQAQWNSLFVNYTGNSKTGDYHLQSGSAAIAAGTTQCASVGGLSPCTPPADFSGSAQTSPPSAGAYVFNGSGAPVVSLSPTSLSFGSQNLNTTSASQNIVLSNVGTATLTVSSITSSGDFSQTNNCPTSLGASLSCTISVTFTPTVAGSRTGTITVTDNASGSPHTSSLSGTGVSTSVTLAPSSVAFGNQTVGVPSSTHNITFSNTGGSTVSISSISFGSSSATPAFVQVNAATPQSATASVPVAFTSNQTAGNLNVVAVGWYDVPTITSVTDTRGNTYTLAVATLGGPTAKQSIYYAKNIAAGSNTVTVTFSGAATFPDVRILEYSGIDTASPFDVAVGAFGTGTAASSGSATTTAANELIFGAGTTGSHFTAPGSGFTTRIITTPDADIAEDKSTTVAGSNSATATTSSADWVMQMATFKAASGSTNPGDFTQTNNCGATLTSGSSCTIGIQFAPIATGARSATLFVVDSAPGSPHTSSLTGTGVSGAPIASLAPTSLTFSSQLVGTTSAGQTITLTNTGTATLNITSATVNGDFQVSSPCGTTLAPNASCVYTVTFTPTTTGTRSGTFTLTDNASGSPHTVPVSGTGVSPAASFSPTSVSFGSFTVGQTSSASTVTLTNTGTATLTGMAESLTGTNPGDFSISANTCGTTLAVSASCAASVKFSPTTAGSRTANLHFVNSASNSPQDVALSGTGVAAVPIASISPSSLTFTSTTVGVTSASQNVTLQNTGTATLSISSITISGDFAISANGCGSTLTATSSCIVSVTFTPTTTGSRTGTLTFTDNASGSPQTIALSGTGTAPTAPIATITPSSLTFANQIINTTSASQSVSLQNTGNATLNITSITASGDFAISANTCGATLAATFSCSISITFTPTAIGARSGALTFVDNAAGSPQTVPLSGSGVSAPVPVATVSPSSLTFGSTTVGTSSAAQVVTLQNTGTATMNISSIAVTGDYSLTTTCGSTLGTSGSCTVNVTFSPTATGTRTGTLSFTDNASGSPQSIPLTGTGTAVPAPAATISPSSLSFPSTTVGVSSSSLPVTLQNTGNASLTITSIASSGDFSQTNNCGASLAASSSCTVNVTFLPTATGTRSGVLTFTDNATGSPQTVTLTGTGAAPTAPIATISPSSLSFSGQIVTTTSSSQTVTLHNTGNATLNISSVTISGDFSISSATCGSTLAASASCVANITFTPTATGTRSGTLTFTDNASGSPQTVPLSGQGVPAPQPIATISPSSLSFANQTVGTTSASQDVTLQNTGNATMNIASIATSGDFGKTTTCGSTLAAGVSCLVHVTFTPTASGPRSGNLSFTDDASGSPQTVSLSGTGLAVFPSVSLSTSSLDLGSQQVTTTSPSQSVVVTNNGTGTLTFSSIAITGTNAADYNLTNGCGGTLAAGANCTLSVTFTPSSTGTRTAAITLTDDAASSPQSVSLTGQGTPAPAPQVTLSPTSLTFASQATGTSSSAQIITLTNSGDATLSSIVISLAGSNPGDYSKTTTCGSTLAANASCTISVTFSPTAAGTRTASVSISDNATGSPQTVPLSGTAFVPTPAVSLSTNSITFAGQNVNTSSNSQPVTVTNSGTGTLTISSVSSSGDFSQTNNCSSVVVNGTCTINVTFTPTAVGNRTGTLTITDNASGSPHTVSLSGTGLGAIGGVNPSSLTFSNQGVGTGSVGQAITISNTGNIAQTVSFGFSGTNAGDFGESDNCAGSVAAGGNCAVTVVFTPAATGSRTANLVVTGNATNSPQTVTLSGTGVQASLSISPTTLAFGSQPVGGITVAQSTTLTNVGTAPVTITSLSITGPNSTEFVFSSGGTCVVGTPMSPGGSCTVRVQFQPVSIGSKSASITIVDNAPGSPHTVALTGTGTSVSVSLNPTSLSFGNEPIGLTSSPQTSTLTNTGTANLTISSLGIGGGGNPGDFSQTNDCPGTLTPSSFCTITARFAPTTTGARTATVNLVGNVNASLPLSGTGTQSTASFSPSTVAFGNQALGIQSGTQSTVLTNIGAAPLTITAISLLKTTCSATFSDTFSGGTLDAGKWTIANGIAPGNSSGINNGSFNPSNISLAQGMLEIDLTQTGASNPVTSVGGEITSIPTFGYGVYEWVMREGSTSATPNGAGSAVTGQVSTGFTFVNNSQTEVDFETEGQTPSIIELTNWNGIANNQTSNTTLVGAAAGFHSYKFVWQATEIDFYIDGSLVSTHTQNIPSTPANALIGFWGTNSASFGGVASVNTIRRMFVSSFSYKPLTCGATTDYTQTNNCGTLPATINPGNSCTFNAKFTPSVLGEDNAALQVTSNSPGSPQLIPFTGTGVAPTVTLTPPSFNYGSQVVTTTSASQAFTVTNTGSLAVIISAVNLTGSGASNFGITSNSCITTLQPSTTCTIRVTFTPATVGTKTATVSVTSTAQGSPQQSSISGTGVSPAVGALIIGGNAIIGGSAVVGVQ